MPTILSTESASNGDDHHNHHHHSGLDSGNYEDHHHQTAKKANHILARDLPSVHDSSYRLSALNGKKTLPSGVRFILDGDTGTPLESVHGLCVNGQYVCSSTVHFTRLDNGQLRIQSSSNPIDQVDNSSRQSQHLLRVSTATNRLLGMCSTSVQHPARPKHHSSNGSSLTLSTNGPLSRHSSTSNSTVRPKIVALLRGSCRAELGDDFVDLP